MSSLFSYGRAQIASVSRWQLPVRRVRLWGDAVKIGTKSSHAHPSDVSLSAMIEAEIIPRLVASRPASLAPVISGVTGGDAPSDGPTSAVTDRDVEEFTPLTLSAEADALMDFIEALIARGVPVDTVLVDLLAPTARQLGRYWEDDVCDFVDVTMGLWRLQEIVHELSAYLPAATWSGPRWRALFTPMPGDQHSFGSILLDEISARSGWFTDRLGDVSESELLDRIAADPFDLVGLTVGCESHMAALPSLIEAVRRVSANPQVCVMVGGRIFVEAPARATEVGADGTAPDARIAVQVAGRLVGAVSRRDFARG